MNPSSEAGHRRVALRVVAGPFYDLDFHREAVAGGMSADLLPPDLQLVWTAADAHVRETGGHADTTLIRQEVPSWPPDLAEDLAAAQLGGDGDADALSYVAALRKATAEHKADDLRAQAGFALARGEFGKAQVLLAAADGIDADLAGGKSARPRIEFVSSDVIFAPLPPMQWVSQGLMLGPGRPCLVGAYGGGKTLMIQSLALSAAAGRPLWERFEVLRPMRIKWMDYEMGRRDVYRRFQRLSIGAGIDSAELDDRLQVASMPSVYLTSADAADDLKRASEDVDLLIIDSFRAACPGVDENDSSVRQYLDVLTRLSETAGTAYLTICHFGKPRDGRSEQHLLRGSAAINDSAGLVLNVHPGKRPSDPRRVHMAKPPTSMAGAPLDDFGLLIEDVLFGEDRAGGVRVVWRALAPEREATSKADDQYAAHVARLLSAILENAGASQATIILKAGIQKQRAKDLLESLVDAGRIAVLPGPRGKMSYRVVGR
jgi:hypothetical protein